MNPTLIRSSSLLIALAAFTAPAADNRWSGGDQSEAPSTDSTFHIAENWSLGAVPAGTGDSNFIDTDGDFVRWISSSSGYNLSGPLTIGSDADPVVEVRFESNRNPPPKNTDPTQLIANKKVSILGANTSVYLGPGMKITLKSGSPAFEIDEDASLTGEGILVFQGGIGTIPGRDYDGIWLNVGGEGANQNTPISGDIKTTGQLTISQGGTAGVNGLSILNLAGHTAEVGEVILGLKDARPNDAGDQSAFGSIDLHGGTLIVHGDVTCLGNPDGCMIDQTSLTQQNSISSEGGVGTLRIEGSFSNILTRSGERWTLENVNLVLDGDGTSVQDFEVLSDDLGDTLNACIGNFYWKSVTLGPNASVRLVDVNDNARTATGAECLYVGTLTIPEGATLDLHGITVYVLKNVVAEGEIIANGGRIVQLRNAGLFSTVTRVLGTPGTAPTSLGYWVGAMAAGDMDGDGRNELAVMTIDERPNDPATTGDDSGLYVLRYDGSVITDVAPFPMHDSQLGISMGNGTMFTNFQIDDLGIGLGPRLYYCYGGHARVRTMDINGNSALATPDENLIYGAGQYILCDLINDARKEIITTARDGSKTLRVYDATSKELLWSAPIAGSNNIQAYCGVADLDGDGDLEIFSVATGSGATYGLSAFHHDGTPYFAEQPLHFTASPGESYGGVSAADVTGDGVPEFIFAGSKGEGLTVLAQDGTELFHATNCNSANGFALLDVDRDGVYEILHGNKLYKGDGTVLQTLPTPSNNNVFTQTVAPVLADFNGDQIPEAVYLYAHNNDSRYGRYVTVYDFDTQSTLAGFPRALEAELLNPADSTWRAGQFEHWTGSSILVADLDKDGTWEIVVGVGVDTNNTDERPTLNIIDTPYHYELPLGRTPEEAGWYSYRHDSIGSFRYPLYKQMCTLLILQ